MARVALCLLGEYCTEGTDVAAAYQVLKVMMPLPLPRPASPRLGWWHPMGGVHLSWLESAPSAPAHSGLTPPPSQDCLGELPFNTATADETATGTEPAAPAAKAEGRPVVLADGSYAQQSAHDGGDGGGGGGGGAAGEPGAPKLRGMLLGGDYFLATVVATTLAKLALRSRQHLAPEMANLVTAHVMLLLSGLLQLGAAGTAGQTMDADSQERITMFLHVLSNSSAEVRGGIASASRLPASLPMLGGVPSHLTHFTLSRSAHGGVPPPPRPPRVSVQVQHLCLSQCREAFSTMLAERQVVIPPPSLHHWVIYPLTLLTPSRRCSPSDRPPRPPRRPPRRTSWRTRGKPTTWYACHAMPPPSRRLEPLRPPLVSSLVVSPPSGEQSRPTEEPYSLGIPPHPPTGLPPSFPHHSILLPWDSPLPSAAPVHQVVVRQLRGRGTDLHAMELEDDDDISMSNATVRAYPPPSGCLYPSIWCLYTTLPCPIVQWQGGAGAKEDFASRLKRVTQLTGLSDPVYAEAYVTVHSYDILLEVRNLPLPSPLTLAHDAPSPRP